MKPIYRILIILAMSGIICQAVCICLYRGYEKYYIDTTEVLTALFRDSATHDILFLGSSRPQADIYPAIIDSICHSDSYNSGVDGGNMLEFKIVFDGYLVHHSAPAMVVLNLDLHSMIGGNVFGNHIRYYPFTDNPAVDQGLRSHGHPTWLKKVLTLLCITEWDDYTRCNAVKGLLGRGGTEVLDGDTRCKGFWSSPRGPLILPAEDTLLASKQVEISTAAIKDLKEIIKVCRERRIKLIFIYGPEYEHLWQSKHVANSQEFFQRIGRIASENNITFLRHDSLDICRDPNLFADILHLNKKGAFVYSAILARQLCTAR